MRLRITAAAYALWLAALLVAFYLAHGNDATSLELVLMAGLVPTALQLILLGIDTHGLVAPVRYWFALVIIIVLSYVANAFDPTMQPMNATNLPISPAVTTLVYAFNVVLILAIATIVAGSPERDLLREIASTYALLGAAFLLYVDVTGTMTWGRLTANDITSNVWGLMGLNVCIAALARKIRPPGIAAFVIGLATILLASSREHLLALAVALLVAVVLWLRTAHVTSLVAALIYACVGLFATAFILDPYLINAVNYMGSNVLLLNSTSRGLNSGFTGRVDIWQATIDLWLRHPLFGVGFRQHELFLEGGLPSHNAYLAMLADTGIFGFIVYVWLLVRSTVASWSIEEIRMRRFVVLMLTTYIIFGFFDRRTIDAGNTYSLFFVMACAVALTQAALRQSLSERMSRTSIASATT